MGQMDSLDLGYRVKDNHSRVHFLEKDHYIRNDENCCIKLLKQDD